MSWNYFESVGVVFALALVVCSVGCKNQGPGANLAFIESVFPDQRSWDAVFEVAASHPNCTARETLSRKNFLSAVTHFPNFCNSDSEETNKQELAAFLANVSLETNGAPKYETNGGLCFDSEVGCVYPDCVPPDPTDPTKISTCCYYCKDMAPPYDTYPACPTGYFGRGALQITNPKNYEEASFALHDLDPVSFPDKNFLVDDPREILKEDRAWIASLNFWMNHVGGWPKDQSATSAQGQMTCHDAMVKYNDFGKTVEIINGNLECGWKPKEDFQKKTQWRIAYYKHYAEDLFTVPITPTEYVECQGGGPDPATSRCGLKDNWKDANDNCRTCCTNDAECPAEYPTCFGSLDNPTPGGEKCVCATSADSFLPNEYVNGSWWRQ